MGVFNSRSNANSTILLSKTGRMEGKGGGFELVPGWKNVEIGSLNWYIYTSSSAHMYTAIYS